MRTLLSPSTFILKSSACNFHNSVFAFVLLIISITTSSQGVVRLWDKRFGGSRNDNLRQIVAATDGGYLLVGDSGNFVGQSYYLVKVNLFGQKEWEKTFGRGLFYSAIATSDGGYLLGGQTDSLSNPDKPDLGRGKDDFWVLKIDSKGIKQWSKIFGGSQYETVHAMVTTPDGGYLIGGTSDSPVSGDKTSGTRLDFWGFKTTDYWIVKINSAGQKQWDRTFGGDGNDELTSIAVSTDGGYLIGGYSWSANAIYEKSQPGRGQPDYWVIKIDATGAKQWDKTIGGARDDRLSSIISDTSGGYLLAGSSASDIGFEKSEPSRSASQGDWSSDFWILKIDANGQKKWDKTLGGTSYESLRSVVPSSDRGYLLAGSSSSPAGADKTENNNGFFNYWIVKVSELGQKQWDRTFGSVKSNVSSNSMDELQSAVATADQGYLLGGFTNAGASGDVTETHAGGIEDYWILKLTSATKCGPEGCKDAIKDALGINSDAGNVYRPIRDLEVWGSVGEQSLVWMRHWNTRSADYIRNFNCNWTHPFQYDVFDAGRDSMGRPLLMIHYPEGEQNLFVQETSGWKPTYPGISKQLFQSGNEFFLQRVDGFRYRFLKLTKSTSKGDSVYYQLKDFKDNHQNLYQLDYNNDLKLVRVSEPAGRYFQITYASEGFTTVISKVTTSDGRSVKYNYTAGLLASVDYDDGTHATYSYKANSLLLEKANDPRFGGAATQATYDYSDKFTGFIKDVRSGVTEEVLATLNTAEELKTISYPYGRKQVYNMPEAQLGQVKSYTNGLGSKTEYEYNEAGIGFLKTSKDALGRLITYNETTLYGNPLKISYPDGTTEVWTRDTLDNVLTYTDQLGIKTIYKRDLKNRVERIDYPDGSYETFTNYNSFGQAMDHLRRNGGTEHFDFDTRGLLRSFKDAEGNTTVYDYDGSDRLKTMTDARGNNTTYAYNDRGLITKMVNADGSSQKYEYDDFGNQTKVTNELDKSWTTEYDEFRRPKKTTDPLNRTTTYSYELPAYTENKPTKVNLLECGTTTFAYDAEWNLILETVAPGTADEASTFYQYNIVGNRVASVDALGKIWRTDYDVMDRIKSKTDPLGNTTWFWYDKIGRLDSTKRPDSAATKYSYDDINRITTIADPLNQIIKQEYDAEGNVVKLTDPKNNVYAYKYDKLNRTTKLTYPDNKFDIYEYDKASNLKTFTNRAGNKQTLEYDNRNRNTTATWDDNITPAISNSYDNANRLLTKSSAVSALSYDYTEANELKSETEAIAGAPASKTVNYTYTGNGLLQTLKYPNGNLLSYDYTGRCQTAAVKENGQPVVRYKYDLNGNLKQKELTNNTTLYDYDAAGRTLSIDNQKACSSLIRFDYGYDKLGRVNFVQRNGDKGHVYVYDAVNRLTDVNYDVANPDGSPSSPARTVHYNLDSVGNRKLEVDNGIATNYKTNSLNQYTNVGGVELEYTPNGNLITRDGWALTYDAKNKLVQLEKRATATTSGERLQSGAADTLIKLVYDAAGRMIKTIFNGLETLSYFSGSEKIEERSTNDESVKILILSPAEASKVLFERSISGNERYYHEDGEGKISMVTDQTGEAVEYHNSDAFDGNTLIVDKNGNVIPLSEVSIFTPLGGLGLEKLVSGMRLSPKTGAVYDTRLGLWVNDPRTRSLKLPRRSRTFKPATGQEESWSHWLWEGVEEYSQGVQDVFQGEAMGAYEFGAGTANAVIHPIETGKGIYNALSNPRQTAAAIKALAIQTADTYANGSLQDQGNVTLNLLLGLGTIFAPLAEIKVAGDVAKLGKLEGLANARALGVLGEQAVGVSAKVRIPSLTRTAKFRVPDKLNLTAKVLEEVKNVEHLNFTRQLKDFHLYSQQQGLQMIIHTRSATTFSSTLQKLIDQGSIIVKHIPF